MVAEPVPTTPPWLAVPVTLTLPVAKESEIVMFPENASPTKPPAPFCLLPSETETFPVAKEFDMVELLTEPTSPPAFLPLTFPVAKEFDMVEPLTSPTSPPTMTPFFTLTVEYEFETEDPQPVRPIKPPA